MRVFSVEMLVKEEGAAVVEAALKRLKAEAQQVAAEMKVTTKEVTSTGNAMKAAGAGAEIAKDKAAKAAIGFAAVGQAFARTGSLTADMGTRMIEAGSQIATMFGPAGLAVGAVLGFAAAAVTSFLKAGTEAEKMAQTFEKSLQDIVNSGDVITLTKQLRDLEMGTAFGAVEVDNLGNAIVNTNDGIAAMRARIDELKKTGFTTFNRANREELNRLTTELDVAEKKAARLRAAIMAPAPATLRTPAAITTTAGGGGGAGGGPLGALPGMGPGATQLGNVEGLVDQKIEAMRQRIPQAIGPVLTEAQRSVADAAIQLERTFAMSISTALTTGIIAGIENAVATGSIGEGFKALSTTLLAGLGDAMIQFGVQSAAFASLMDTIMTSLSSLIPGGALAASLAMIGIGAALKGVARGMFNSGSRGGGGAFSSVSFGGGMSSGQTTQLIFGSTSATTAAGMTPRSAMNVTIIGPNDPSAQRAMQELLAKADSRGRLG